MEKWTEKIHPINTYNPNARSNDYYYNIGLSDNLSPITKFLLNTSINVIGKKNIIITYPDSVLRPLPLLAYTHSYLQGKSTLVFTQKSRGLEDNSTRDIHNLDYYMLNWDGEYLFYDIPIGFLYKDKLDAKVQMPLAKSAVRKRYIENQKKLFLIEDKPKVLLYSDNGIRMVENISSLIFDNAKIKENEINMNIGCIIFENVDRFVNSDFTSKAFLNWISKFLNSNINFIFHFSNPESPYIDFIKDQTDSFVIPFNTGLLKNNNGLNIPSKKYYEQTDKYELKIIRNYNIDCPVFYEHKNNFDLVDSLDSGNIDHFFKQAKALIERVDRKNIKNKQFYFRSIGLLYTLQDLVINPSKFKFSFNDNVNGWRYYKISEFIELFRRNLTKESELNSSILSEYISQIENIFNDLSRCKRYGEEGSFNRIGKDYKILEILNNRLDYFDKEDNILIAAYSNSESSILKQELERLNISNVEIKHAGWLNNSSFDRSKYGLILPGPLPLRYLSELFMPYNKILALSYDGYNNKRLLDQINLISAYTLDQERRSMSYFAEIYDYIGIQKNDKFFEDFHARAPDLRIDSEPEKPVGLQEKLKSLISKESSEYDKDIDNLSEMIKELKHEDEETENLTSGEVIELYLRNLENDRKYKKSLSIEKTYFYLKNIGGKILQGTPKILKPGYFVVVLDNDERKTLLQLIIEMYGLENDIDTQVIEFWKERLIGFMEDNQITYRELYDTYNSLGGERGYQTVMNWAKGAVLGPDDPKDLFLIGKLIDENILMENYILIENEIDKVRNIHRTTGRKLSNVIKTLIFEGNRLDTQNLSYEESLFYEKVNKGIYEIMEIQE